MKPFDLTQKAKADLKEVAKLTMNRWGREQRNIYLKQFDDTFCLLSERPEIGKSCAEIRNGYLKFPQGSHVIFFRKTTQNRIEIVRILHKSMDVEIHFGA
ncbi:type II toxin-antitoxin system RelE/ParE family toxin [Endozoicomonas numazuensis]|uniref:Toxin n=1 Tax=Endozoicomonas numazuensis TaxID=1137799 RepID=A0A081NF71_9GAMM|nr:type II toxin-antitoxin system RelE/ParE family toxin [Endozoicomonas numazuensis]KEQ17094.1 plasmid stabilization protein ParE [Endozoicomonas numazuensis]